MKRKVTLIESYLHRMIRESVKQVLNEISINDKYNKETQNGKNTLPFETYQQLCELDPTTTPNKVGKYANWILQKYNPNANFESLRVALKWYANGIKRNILQRYGISSDINSFKTYEEFIDAINGIKQRDVDSQMSNSEYNKRQVLNGQFKVLGSSSTYDIIQPLTYDAEYHFGSTTEWCTVGNEDTFNGYMKKGPLFILYPKNRDHKKKMQFHFETNSFADWEDDVSDNPMNCIEGVIKDENELNELCQLCRKVWSNHIEKFIPFKERLTIALQHLAHGEDPEDIFDDVEYINEGLSIVVLNSKYNFINKNGEIMFEQWFEYVDDFDEGFAGVELNHKGWNFINQNGEIISKDWYTTVRYFKDGFAGVYLNGKGWNFINQNGEIISERWYDEVSDFYNGFAHVHYKGKRYKLDGNGVLYDYNTVEPVTLTQESKMERIIKSMTSNILNEIYNNR